jgi:hypothetical protein
MDHFKEKDVDVAYIIPHKNEDLTLHVRHTANAWWKDATKVYRLLDAFDNHGASIFDACVEAGITRRQYKYFAEEHPVIYLRIRRGKFAQKERELHIQKSILAQRVIAGDVRAAAQFLFFDERPQYDRRFKSDRAKLRRMHKIPAEALASKETEEKLEDMEKETEKTRIDFGHPSKPEHYAVCNECRHLLNPTETIENKEVEEVGIFFI